MIRLVPAMVILGLLLIREPSFSQSPLPHGSSKISEVMFKDPSSVYGNRCWWWWLNGNVTRESIHRDLVEMKAKGFSGACIFDAGGADQRGNAQVPEGPLFGSPAWRELFRYAVSQADSLGLILSLNIQSGWNLGGPDIQPSEAAKQVTFSEIVIAGPSEVHQKLPLPPTRDGYYGDIAILAIPVKKKPHAPIRDFEDKAALKEVGWSVPDTRFLLTDTASTDGEEDAKVNQVINITSSFSHGTLSWKAPSGAWRIIRIGYTPTDARVSTSSGKWQGRVLDHLNDKYFNRYWDTHVAPLLSLIGPAAGKTLRYLQTDSFEGGGMNWTDDLEQEFKQRRGYDILPYLPVLTGKIIESREVSNRFLADFRKTLGDLFAEKYCGTFARRAKEYGIGIQPESAGPHAGPFDGLKNYGYSDIMMSEFWSPSPHRSRPVDRFFVKQAASAAKIFNKQLVGAESFTTIGPHWNDIIWADMKPSVDHEFCAGLNLTYLHTFTSSPKEMGLPGQEYFAGTHFNPNVTWWNYSGGFIKYLTRCQYLLQQGYSYADVLYYYGDHVPNLGRYKQDDPGHALPEFDYDLINEDVLKTLTVRNGRLFLPHGVAYRVLVLPDHQVLSLAVIKKLKELVEGGATIIGPKPLTTASLVAYPKSEQVLKDIADELWGAAISASGMNKVKDGRVYWGKTAREVLLQDGIAPDFTADTSRKRSFDFIHRVASDVDYYFVSSQNKEPVQTTCSFRISGRQPELWDPVSGEVMPLPDFKIVNGQTILPLNFRPYGSAFVIFRHTSGAVAHGNIFNSRKYKKIAEIKGPWQVSFDRRWGGPDKITFDSLESWTSRAEEGVRYYSGKAVYSKPFQRPASPKGSRLYLDLGEVKDVGIAQVTVNGRDLGILWCPPYRVEIPSSLMKKKNNELKITVVNSWRNRLIGDRERPLADRYTKTNIRVFKEWQLVPSGLLGPVSLYTSDY